MEYKDIVVHLGTDNRSAARLDAAIELAERYDGRVIGVYVLSRRNIPGFVRCEIPPEVLKRWIRKRAGLPRRPRRVSPNGRQGPRCRANGVSSRATRWRPSLRARTGRRPE